MPFRRRQFYATAGRAIRAQVGHRAPLVDSRFSQAPARFASALKTDALIT
jgi:hypothetical protein